MRWYIDLIYNILYCIEENKSKRSTFEFCKVTHVKVIWHPDQAPRATLDLLKIWIKTGQTCRARVGTNHMFEVQVGDLLFKAQAPHSKTRLEPGTVGWHVHVARNNNTNPKGFTNSDYVCLLCKLLCELGGAKFTARQSCSQGKSACNIASIYFTDNWQMSQDSEPSKIYLQIDEFWYATSRVE